MVFKRWRAAYYDIHLAITTKDQKVSEWNLAQSYIDKKQRVF